MSGGSFDYLCFKPAHEVLAAEADLRRMAALLKEEFGYLAKDAVDATLEVARLGHELQEKVEALSDLWRAIEWWQSCDIDRDSALVALGSWKAKQGT